MYYICANRSEKAGPNNKAVPFDGSFVPSSDKTRHYAVLLQITKCRNISLHNHSLLGCNAT